MLQMDVETTTLNYKLKLLSFTNVQQSNRVKELIQQMNCGKKLPHTTTVTCTIKTCNSGDLKDSTFSRRIIHN